MKVWVTRDEAAGGPLSTALRDAGLEGLERARLEVCELLAASPVMVDEVIRRCQLSPPIVNTVLLELELAGRLERHPGNRVSLAPTGAPD